MKVIILAAGQGERLRPYTNNIPKCMVELGGKPIIQHQIETLKKVNLKEIIIVGGYRAECLDIENIKINLNYNYKTTNMVSTLFCAEEWMQEGEDLIITYGDVIYEPKVLYNLLKTNSPVAISVNNDWYKLWSARMQDPLSDAETLKLDDNNSIIEIGKKPKNIDDIQGQYMGLIKVRGDTIKLLKETWHNMDKQADYDGKDFDNMYMTSFIQHLIDIGVNVKPAFADGGWIEIDTVDDLEHYNYLYSNNELSKYINI